MVVGRLFLWVENDKADHQAGDEGDPVLARNKDIDHARDRGNE